MLLDVDTAILTKSSGLFVRGLQMIAVFVTQTRSEQFDLVLHSAWYRWRRCSYLRGQRRRRFRPSLRLLLIIFWLHTLVEFDMMIVDGMWLGHNSLLRGWHSATTLDKALSSFFCLNLARRSALPATTQDGVCPGTAYNAAPLDERILVRKEIGTNKPRSTQSHFNLNWCRRKS